MDKTCYLPGERGVAHPDYFLYEYFIFIQADGGEKAAYKYHECYPSTTFHSRACTKLGSQGAHQVFNAEQFPVTFARCQQVVGGWNERRSASFVCQEKKAYRGRGGLTPSSIGSRLLVCSKGLALELSVKSTIP